MGITPEMWRVMILLVHVADALEVGAHLGTTEENQNDNTRTTVLHSVIKHSSPGAMVEGERLEDLGAYIELRRDPINRLPSAFTICSTAMSSTGDIIFFTLLGEDGNQVLMALFSNDGARRKGQKQTNAALFVSETMVAAPTILGLVFPKVWLRSCLALSTESGLVQWVVEGHLLLNNTFEVLTEENVLPHGLAGRLLHGLLQWENHWYTSDGKISNVNIFSSALSIEAMRGITSEGMNGECDKKGDYLAWEDMEWNLHGKVSKEAEQKDRICRLKQNITLFYTKFPHMDVCMTLCQKFGTRSPSVVTFEEWSSLQLFLKQELFDRLPNNSLKVWMSMRKKGDQWRDFYDSQLIQYQPVSSGNAVSAVSENWLDKRCVAQGSEERWYPHQCYSDGNACACTKTQDTQVQLRGLCPESMIDTLFAPMNGRRDITKLVLRGLKQTTIWFDTFQKAWMLTNAWSNTTGTSSAPKASYAIGVHSWAISDDQYCNEGQPYTAKLKLTACKDDEFTCHDGLCVSMTKRCDQMFDCRDYSDEMGCQMLHLKPNYRKTIPPRDASVNVSIDILKIVSIEEITHSTNIQFQVTLEWQDDRMFFHNLKEKSSLNKIEDSYIGELWLPVVIYENTDQKESTRLGNSVQYQNG